MAIDEIELTWVEEIDYDELINYEDTSSTEEEPIVRPMVDTSKIVYVDNSEDL